MNPDEIQCPIKHDIENFESKSMDFIKAFRKIRRELNKCKTCPVIKQSCPYRAKINDAIDQAIIELNQEWGMS